jgi:hypothetical protein
MPEKLKDDELKINIDELGDYCYDFLKIFPEIKSKLSPGQIGKIEAGGEIIDGVSKFGDPYFKIMKRLDELRIKIVSE